MKKLFAEETVLFMSLVKWFFLAAIIGIIVGISTAIFLKSLEWGIGIGQQQARYFILLPVSLFLSTLIIKIFAPEAGGHGTEKILEAIHKRSGRINVAVVPIKLLTTVITIASGGSAGKEGPAAQIGSALSSLLADVYRFNDRERRKLVVCGISAGFSAVFGTPIAGAIFGLEVLVAGMIVHEDLFPSFVAGVISFQVANILGIHYYYNHIQISPIFNHYLFFIVVGAGIFFGLCSLYFIEIIHLVKKLADKIRIWEPFKGLIGGLILIGLVYLFSSKMFLGLGTSTIESTLHGERIIWYAFLVKGLFTAITLSFGGSGGVITPIFFIGTAAGAFFAQLFGLDVPTFAAIGLVALLSGATNTPIASSIMAVELFGPTIAPYAALACIISFLMTGHRSVYPSQVLGIRKSMSLSVDIGMDMEKIKTTIQTRDRSFIGILLKILHRFQKSRFNGNGDSSNEKKN
ncbi:MAG: chloride channel protein [Candidatus Cloacimonetes bacterium]|nr:chloride channel protein [Candidatus Cloacimonadota bacterium]